MMKSVILAITCVVLAYSQVLTFTNEFVPTYEETSTTNLILIKNNGKFENGNDTINTIKFRIGYESATSSAVFNPQQDELFGAIVGGAEGFLYFDVNGNEGTYQCNLNVKYTDSNGKTVKADPYRFTFTILKKKSRDVVFGRVAAEEIVSAGFNKSIPVIHAPSNEIVVENQLQTRQGPTNPECPTPSSSEGYWSSCNVMSLYPQPTSNTMNFKNYLPSGVNSTMQIQSITFTNVSPSTAIGIKSYSGPNIQRLATCQVNFQITSSGSCDTWFTINVNYKRSGGSTIFTWSTVFNPVNTVPVPGYYCVMPSSSS